ncbi:MAG: hypothetical protein KIT25_21340 [Enhydrobacter sp.]|nr:MAG: hypothetical protein KIT25_21340 [Enhydrobacter sp.]
MQAGPLLRSERLQRYRALGAAGDPVWRTAGQLRAALAQRLSREHADLLAVPEVDPTGNHIDWYAPFDGEARRLGELPESERAALLDKVHRLHADMAALAQSMEAPDRSSAEHSFARLLRHALSAPGEETLHVVDGRPVMTFWGFAADATLPGVFLASPPVAPRPAAREAVLASTPVVLAQPGMRTAWWQWVLLAALLLLLLALLAWAIRPYLPHLEARLAAEARERALALATDQPVAFQQTRMASLIQDNELLRRELASLGEEATRRGVDCAAGLVVPGGGVVGATGDGPPIERGADPDAKADVDVAAKGPDEKSTTPLPGAPDQDKAKSQDQGGKDEPKPMVVPPEAKQKQDLAFLKGDWRSRTGLATAQGEKDLRPSYTLDDKGKGKVSFVQKNGAVCEAPAEARWDGGKLVIEEKSNPKCSDGRTYARNTVNCEIGADGVAQCKGSQPGDSRSYNVQIGR